MLQEYSDTLPPLDRISCMILLNRKTEKHESTQILVGNVSASFPMDRQILCNITILEFGAIKVVSWNKLKVCNLHKVVISSYKALLTIKK